MKKRGLIRLVALGGVLCAALVFLIRGDSVRPALPAFAEMSVLVSSNPLRVPDPVSMPEIVLSEEELPDQVEVMSGGEKGHSHAFRLIASREATCSAAGERSYRCDCGKAVKESISPLLHSPTAATCTEPGRCTVCGEVLSAALGHHFSGDTCARCGYTLSASFYVLDREVEFDESADSVRGKLGSPTEVVYEGDLFTLVYAADMRRLTFVQCDGGGVWGVYSLDPNQRMRWGGRSFGLGDFAGQRALNSPDESLWFNDVTIFGFRDQGALYALWMRLNEYEYNYAAESAVYDDFSGQEKLSWYLVNALRIRAGARSLIRSIAADAVARDYCDYMIATGYFEHDHSFEWRLTEKGVPWRLAGENLSQGYTNSLFVCDAYLNSPDHRENLLNGAFTHVGLSYQKQGGTVWGAQEFYCLQ